MTEEQREQALKDRAQLIEALEQIEAAMMDDMKALTIGDENLDVEECVKSYLTLREQREQTKDRWERRDATLRSSQDLIEAALGVFLQTHKQQGLNTKYGTVFTSAQSTARVADKDAFLSFLRANDAWALANIAANKATVTGYLEEKGELPPGVDYSQRIKVQIRRK
jgi:urease accessory protein UreF